MGWGEAISHITGWFTPQQRTRRLKDELDKLQRRRNEILSKGATVKGSGELLRIDNRISELNRLLANSAN